MKLRNLLIAAAGLTIAAAGATAASAHETHWQAHHPYRVQVNHRISDLNRSIERERREGRISVYQARRMHAHVHSIGVQEAHFASRHGSHIGRFEQARLNREESGVRNQIR
jgi:hypothetical protein